MTAVSAGKLQISSIVDFNEMDRLEDDWNALAEICETATVFQTYAWNAAWWRHYGQRFGHRLRIVLVREPQAGGKLIGLAPMMISSWYGTPIRRLSFIGTGASDYLDVLCVPERAAEILEALCKYLASSPAWQVADWQQLRPGGAVRRWTPTPENPLTFADTPQEACPYVTLPGDWAEFTQSLGKKTRTNIAYHNRMLVKLYDVEIGYVTDPASLEHEMSRLFTLHQRRWNDRWLPGVFGTLTAKRFHRDVAAALLKQGWLRLFYIHLDDETQASLYCFAFKDRLCYYQGGFEPDMAKLSLGTVLTAKALETAISEHRAEFDFLRGNEPYKAKWTGDSRTNVRRLLTRRGSPLGLLAASIERVESHVERNAKAWLRARKSASAGAGAPP